MKHSFVVEYDSNTSKFSVKSESVEIQKSSYGFFALKPKDNSFYGVITERIVKDCTVTGGKCDAKHLDFWIERSKVG